MNRMNQPPRHMPTYPGDEMFAEEEFEFDQGGLPRMNVGENEIDPRERLKQRLLASMDRRQAISMDPNLAMQARDIQSGNNLAALGSEAASKFGLIGGKGPESILGKNMQAQNKVMDDRVGDMAYRDKMEMAEDDRQLRVAQVLARLKDEREKTAALTNDWTSQIAPDGTHIMVNRKTGEVRQGGSYGKPGGAGAAPYQFQELGDGSTGTFNKNTGEFNLLPGKFPKPIQPGFHISFDGNGNPVWTPKDPTMGGASAPRGGAAAPRGGAPTGPSTSPSGAITHDGKNPVPKPSAGIQAFDRELGKEAQEYLSGGRKLAQDSIAILRQGAEELEVAAQNRNKKGAIAGWKDDSYTGPAIGLVSKLPGIGRPIHSAMNPKAVALQNRIGPIATSDLRQSIGAAFTATENFQYQAFTYDPSLPEEENAKALRQKADFLEGKLQEKDALYQEFLERGTGRQYKAPPLLPPTPKTQRTETPTPAPSMQPANSLDQDVEIFMQRNPGMSREEAEYHINNRRNRRR